MRVLSNLSMFLCLLALVIGGSAADPRPPPPRAMKMKSATLPPGHEHTPVAEPSVDLSERFDSLARSLRENRDRPGDLLRNLVEFSLRQLDAYKAIKDGSASFTVIRMKYANNTPSLLLDVVANFKTGLKSLLQRMAKGEATREHRLLKDIDPENVLQLHQLYGASCATARYNRMMRSYENIRCAVDLREILVERFLAAFPLVKRMADVIDAIHDCFTKGDKAALPKALDGSRN